MIFASSIDKSPLDINLLDTYIVALSRETTPTSILLDTTKILTKNEDYEILEPISGVTNPNRLLDLDASDSSLDKNK